VSGWGLSKRRSASPYRPYGSGRTLHLRLGTTAQREYCHCKRIPVRHTQDTQGPPYDIAKNGFYPCSITQSHIAGRTLTWLWTCTKRRNWTEPTRAVCAPCSPTGQFKNKTVSLSSVQFSYVAVNAPKTRLKNLVGKNVLASSFCCLDLPYGMAAPGYGGPGRHNSSSNTGRQTYSFPITNKVNGATINDVMRQTKVNRARNMA